MKSQATDLKTQIKNGSFWSPHMSHRVMINTCFFLLAKNTMREGALHNEYLIKSVHLLISLNY